MSNAPEPITNVINHFSYATIRAGLFGPVGYLFARSVTQINPQAGFACAATFGAITHLFWDKGSTFYSKMVCIASLVFIPFQVCEKLNLPITLRQAQLITGVTCAAYLAFLALMRGSGKKSISNVNLYEEVD